MFCFAERRGAKAAAGKAPRRGNGARAFLLIGRWRETNQRDGEFFSDPAPPPAAPGAQTPRAGGIIIELARDDYIVAGFGFRLAFQEMQGPPRNPEFLSIEEGTFQDGKWIARRRLNGDELRVTLFAGPRILRVRLRR
jgi:hypothetical protein